MKKKFFIFLFCFFLFVQPLSVLAFDIDSSTVVNKVLGLTVDANSFVNKTTNVTTKAVLFALPMADINNSDFYVRALTGAPSYSCYFISYLYCNDLPADGVAFDKRVNASGNDRYIIANKGAGDYDITDLVKKGYDSDYKYLVLFFLPDPVKKGDKYIYTQGNYFDAYQVSNYVPTPAPTLAPTSAPTSVPPVPSASPDLSDHNWKLIVYEAWTSENHTLSVPVTTKHVPYATGNMEQHIFGDSSGTGSSFGVYGQVFTYRVKIPFRFECVDFEGIGNFGAHVSFDTEIGSGYFPDNSGDDMQVTFTYSTPWIESVDSTMSFDATGPGSGYPTGFNIHGASLTGETTPEYYYCFDTFAYVSSSHTFLNFGNELKVTLRNVTFNITDSVIESNRLPSDVLNSIDKGIQDTNETIKQEHQEEIDKSEEAVNEASGAIDDVTSLLSSWEIITMPVTLIVDFCKALESDGSTGFTFPSFTLMGEQLWPSYTFDLQVIADKFPVLYNSLHIVSGILVVIGFIRYCYNKWAYFFGPGEIPEEDRYT